MGLKEQLRRAVAVAAESESLEALGRKWNVSPPVLGRFLRAERGMNLDTADRIASSLGLFLATKTEAAGLEVQLRAAEERIARSRLDHATERLKAMEDRLDGMTKELRGIRSELIDSPPEV